MEKTVQLGKTYKIKVIPDSKKEIDGIYMFCQIGPSVGCFVCVAEGNIGNRLSDTRIPINLIQSQSKTLSVADVEFPEIYEVEVSFLKKTKLPNETVKKDVVDPKKDVVSFFRYVRPVNKHGEIDNLRGATLLFNLNYASLVGTVTIAICDGDNFDKMEGRQICTSRRETGTHTFFFNFPHSGIPKEGVVPMVIEKLRASNLGYSITRKLLEMYDARQ